MTMNRKKSVTILGSSGSIGQNSLAVLANLGPDFRLHSASCHANWQELARQARDYELEKVVLTDISEIDSLKAELADTQTEVMGGQGHLEDLVTDPKVDIVIVAVVGAAALPAVLAATKAGKTVAVANKEALVMAGSLVMPLAVKHGATILPIDSEHSAILQAMHAGSREEVQRVMITCSGGPFRQKSSEELDLVSVAEALDHPTWDMGPKITIDSATQMNKALEIVEARWLFDLSADQIEVVIHPESIVHSLVEFCDGSVIAQLSPPDMRLPIQYALTYPDRLESPARRLDLHHLGQLNFEEPDFEKFPALRLGFEVAEKGGTAGAVLNAANEAAVQAFREGQIGFKQIAELTEHCLQKHQWIKTPTLEDIMEADQWARNELQNSLVKEEIKQP
jgi:1-deoxy-D-xylulose-5-phosphate reductoisomerase